MKTIESTPGPWAYEEETGRIYYADGDVEPTIAFVYLDNTLPEQSKADARLIAAAPELLAALEHVYTLVDPGVSPDAPWAIEKARSSIVKAKAA